MRFNVVGRFLCVRAEALSPETKALLQSIREAESDTLTVLKAKKRANQVERASIAKDMRNEQGKKQRLMSKVAGCTAAQLLEAAALKAAAQAKAEARCDSAAAGNAAGHAAGASS